jgi:site-specific DNA recombinase
MRYAAYARVSSEKQEEQNTVETQLDSIRQYCAAGKIALVAQYVDEDYRGELPLDERPDGRRLLADAAARRIDRLLVFRIDRLARGAINQLVTVAALAEHGVKIVSVTEPHYSDDASSSGRLLRNLSAVLSEHELDTLRERTRAGMQRRAREGRWVNGPPPFGYRKGEDGRLEPDPRESTVVALIFSLYCGGLSAQAVAEALNARGEPQPRGGLRDDPAPRPWYDTTVLKIIRNPVYCGRGEWGRTRTVKKRGRLLRVSATEESERIPFEAPALVTGEQWREAQARREQNTRFSRRNSKRRVYVLSGLIECGECARSYSGTRSSTGAYYHCASQGRRRRGVEPCGNKPVRAELLEEYVWSVVEARAASPAGYEREHEEYFAKRFDDEAQIAEEAARALERVERLKAARARVVRLIRLGPEEGGVSEDEGAAELLAAKRQIDAAEAYAREVGDRQAAYARMRGAVASGKEVLEGLRRRLAAGERPSEDERAEILRKLLQSRIVISKKSSGGRVTAVADVSLVAGSFPDWPPAGLKRYGSISLKPSAR